MDSERPVLVTVRSLAVLWLAAGTASGQNAPAAPACRAAPGSPDWPAPNIWAQLNETTAGQLIKPVPAAMVCQASLPDFDAGQCYTTSWQWADEYFHSRDPVSVNWNNWSNDTCLPDPLFPCSGDGYPAYVINATTPDHVKAGIEFGEHCSLILTAPSSIRRCEYAN